MKIVPAILVLAATAAFSFGAPSATVFLWPEGRMPGRFATQPEGEKPATGDGVQRLINVSHPTLAVFAAPATAGRPAPALIVCPGGGYAQLAYNKEGTEIAAWLNSLGFTALVLKYRVPGNRDGAFQDVQRALRLTRSHAAGWNIDPRRVGVIGFSAGGHLAARLASGFSVAAYAQIDATDALSCRPDFTVLVYPAYLAAKDRVAPEVVVHADTPPTLIVHSDDDLAFIDGSRLYAKVLEANQIPHLFLLYPTGGHGYGLRSTREASRWPQDAAKWLQAVTSR